MAIRLKEAQFARRNEIMSEARKTTQTETPKLLLPEALLNHRWILSFVVLNDQLTPMTVPIKDAQEMILGDKVYLVIPR